MTNDLSDEDKALFRRMVQGVKPLDSKKIEPRTSPPLKKFSSKPAVEPSTPAYNLSNYYHQIVDADSLLSFGKTTIQHKRWLQLKKGQIACQGRLDLHGLRPDTAQDALCRFIEQQSNVDHRCVLIIHGKGGRHGEVPVLKNLVNHWLQQLPQVLAFHSASGKDGGTGAVYVLLRRQNAAS